MGSNVKAQYERYESMTDHEIDMIMEKICQQRGLSFTRDMKVAWMNIYRQGWLPQIHIATTSGEGMEHNVMVFVGAWQQHVITDEDAVTTQERIARAMCICFLLARDEQEGVRDE